MAITATTVAAPMPTGTTTHRTIVDEAIASVLGGGAPAPAKPTATAHGGLLALLLGRLAHQQDATKGADILQQECPSWPTTPPPAKGHGTPPGNATGPDMPPPPTPNPPPGKEPAGPPAKVDDPHQHAARETYTVRRGDNLSSIGQRVDRTWQQLYWANRDQIDHPDLIFPGQVLRIPPADLDVPPFEYHPRHTRRDEPVREPKDTRPSKRGQHPGHKPDHKPDHKAGTDTPPSSRPPVQQDDPPRPRDGDDQLPSPPPAPDGSHLPPALPMASS